MSEITDTEMIVKQCCAIAKALRCHFTVRDKAVSIEDVLSVTGLLPQIMRRADQLSSFCLGYGLGISIEEAQGAMAGERVKFDMVTPNSLRLLCFSDVLIELIQQAPSRDVTPLDDLLYQP